MATIQIRQKLHQYIDTAQDKKVKAIYNLIENQVEEENDYWNDKSFVEELQRVEALHIAAKTKSYSIDEAISSTKKLLKKVK